MNNILLITNEQKIIETFADKLILLRESDELSYCDYEEGPDIVFSDNPDIVIVHEHTDKEKTINLIKYIKTRTESVLLLINDYDRDFILNAYDEGIDDYFAVNSDPSEVSIRTVNCIKKDNLKKSIKKYSDYLQKYEILENQIINHKFAAAIGEMELSANDLTTGSLIILAPDEECKQNYSYEKLIQAIKKSVRYNDIIFHSNGAKLQLLIPNGGINAAITILDKIKQELNNEFLIKAGIAKTGSNNFNAIEKHAQCALSEALLSSQEYVIYSQPNDSNFEAWLDEPKEKNYKLFKVSFNKKLEKVIAPVFYRLQKSWEEKLFNTKIEQFTDETQSIFRLTNPKQTSSLKIIYPGFAKVIVYITHEGLDSPENDEIQLPLNQINMQELTKIIEKFIRDFKSTIE